MRATFAILFPLLPDGAIYCIEDTQTSYWPAWGGSVDPRARGTSMDMVKDLVDGLNHEEFLVEGYEPTYTDTHVRAVHCYHNLVVIEKGDNREGTNRDTSSGHFHGSSPDPAATPRGDPMTVLLATCADLPDGEPGAEALDAALADRGIDFAWAVWDDAASTGPRADLVVVRSTWDYAGAGPRSSSTGPARSTSRACSTAPTSSRGTTTRPTSPTSATPGVPTRLTAVDRADVRGARSTSSARPSSSRGSVPAAPA